MQMTLVLALCFVLLVPVVVVYIWGMIFCRFYAGRCRSKRRVDGMLAIVTGASDGIGKETAYGLAERGANVILASRNIKKGQAVAEWINCGVNRRAASFYELDISDLVSVRAFANQIINKYKKLHILINNAGGAYKFRQETSDRLEKTMATNHYGPFLLTNMLLGLMKSTGRSRIINVSSDAHTVASINLADMQLLREPYTSYKAYGHSKLTSNLCTMYLAKAMHGTGVTVNCLHPGIVATNITAKVGSLLGFFLWIVLHLVGKDCKLGAQTSIYLAVADEVKNISGEYFIDCKVARTVTQAKDFELARRLWQISERDVKLQDYENYIHFQNDK